MRFILAPCLLAIALTATPGAAAPSSDSAVMGAGTQTCAQFAKHYASDPQQFEGIYFTWAQGYMSGLNDAHIMHKERPQNLDSRTMEEQKTFIRDYCDRHPLTNYVNGVFALYVSLQESSYQSRK